MSRPAARIDRAANDAAMRMLRRYGEMTSNLRGGPNFAIIGAKRGGTTSVYRYLLEHPSISPLFPGWQHLLPGRQYIKRTRYYDVEFGRGARWYRSHFPLAAGDRHLTRPWRMPSISGEASPYYLFHPLAAERLANDFPDVRLIVMVRDPVERAYSHYKERCQHGGESLSFEDALDAEATRLRGEADRIIREPGYRSVEHEDHSYLAQGRYVEMLDPWFSFFPREQFHFAVSEEFYQDPDRTVNEIWSFLGLNPRRLKSRARHSRSQLPGSDIRPATRQHLQRSLSRPNHELEQLLGRALPWPAVSPSEVSARASSGEPDAKAGQWTG